MYSVDVFKIISNIGLNKFWLKEQRYTYTKLLTQQSHDLIKRKYLLLLKYEQ